MRERKSVWQSIKSVIKVFAAIYIYANNYGCYVNKHIHYVPVIGLCVMVLLGNPYLRQLGCYDVLKQEISSGKWMPHRIPFFMRADVISKLNSHSRVNAASCSPPIFPWNPLLSLVEHFTEKLREVTKLKKRDKLLYQRRSRTIFLHQKPRDQSPSFCGERRLKFFF